MQDYLGELVERIGADIPDHELETETAFALDYRDRVALYDAQTPSSADFGARFAAALAIMAEGEEGTPVRALTPAAIAWAMANSDVQVRPAPADRVGDEEDPDDTVERAVSIHAGLHLAGHGEPSEMTSHLHDEYELDQQRDHLASLAHHRLRTDPRYAEYMPGDADIADAVGRCCVLGQYMGERHVVEDRLSSLSHDGLVIAIEPNHHDAFTAAAKAIEDDARSRGLPFKGARRVVMQVLEAAMEGAWLGMPHLLDLPALRADLSDPHDRRRTRTHLAIVLITVMRTFGGFMPGDEPMEMHVAAYDGDAEAPSEDPLEMVRNVVEEVCGASSALAVQEGDWSGDVRPDDPHALAALAPDEAAARHLTGDLVSHPAPDAPVAIAWSAVYGLPRGVFHKARRQMTRIGLWPSPDATGGTHAATTVVWSGGTRPVAWRDVAAACAEASRHAPDGFALMAIAVDGREIVVHASKGAVTTMSRTPDPRVRRRMAN